MVIHNLRNPIPTHRPNSPRKPYNIARRRIASLRNIAVRVLPRAILAKDQTLTRPRPRRRFQETRVSWLLRMMLAWRPAAAVVAGEVVWDWSAQRRSARHWSFLCSILGGVFEKVVMGESDGLVWLLTVTFEGTEFPRILGGII
jgi:hypothetical protein